MKTKCNKLIALLLSLTMLMGVVMSTPMTAVAVTPISSATVIVTSPVKVFKSTDSNEEITGSGSLSLTSKGPSMVWVNTTDNNEPEIDISVTGGSFGDTQLFTVTKTNIPFESMPGFLLSKVTSGKLFAVTITPTTHLSVYESYLDLSVTITIGQTAPSVNVTLSRTASVGTVPAAGTQPWPGGTNYPLTVTLYKDQVAAGYQPEVRVNGDVQTNPEPTSEGEGKKYEYNNITIPTQDTEIIVGLVQTQYTVKCDNITGDGYTTSIHTDDKVTHGSNYSFTVTPKEGYKRPTVKYTMAGKEGQSEGGETITPTGDNYIIRGVTGDLTITITGSEKETHTLTFVPAEGKYSFKTSENGDIAGNTATVKHDETYSFKVSLDPQYSKSDITVFAGNTPLTAQEGVYTTPKVTGDMRITVAGVNAPNTYNVALPGNKTGEYTITPSNNGNTVSHQGSYTFTITLDDSQEVTEELKVKYTKGQSPDETTVQASQSENGNAYTCKIDGITDDITVKSIEGYSTKTLNLTDTDTSGPGQVNKDHATVQFTGGPITYGQPASFTVETDQGYKVTSVTCTMGDSIPTTLNTTSAKYGETGLEYKIPKVTDNCSITVTTAKVTVTVTYHDWTPKGVGSSTDYTKAYKYRESESPISVIAENYNVPLEKPTYANYEFKGWYKDSSLKDNPVTSNPITFEHEDATADVYANWVVDYDSLFNVTLNASPMQGTDKVTLDLTVGWSPKDSAVSLAETENIKLVYAGVLYSDKAFTFEDSNKVAGQMKNIVEFAHEDGQSYVPQTITTDYGLASGAGTVYCYSYSNPFPDAQFRNTKTVRFRVKTSRYAVGWIAIRKGDKKDLTFITFSNNNGSDTPVYTAQN